MKRNILFFLIAVLLFSCKKDSEPETKQVLIQPLGVGYYWEFVDSTFSNIGDLTNVDTSRLSITGITNVTYKGESIDLYDWSWNTAPNFMWLCNYDATGFYMYGGKTDNGTYIYEKSLNIKYPVKINEIWDHINYSHGQIGDSSFFYIYNTVYYTCLAVNEPFKTKLGSFDCYNYNYNYLTNGHPDQTYLYYAPNIGYVGMIEQENGITIYKKTLISYNITDSNLSSNKRSDFMNIKTKSNIGRREYGPYR
jgi:hypothetical protein